MTGPERETLSLVLRLLEGVQSDVQEVKVAVQGIDARVKDMEIKDATAVGVAAGSAAAAATSERRVIGAARLFAIVAAATAAGASLTVIASNFGLL